MKESFLRGVAAMVLAAALAGCGGADDHEDPAATASVENPLDSDTLPEGSLSIEGTDETAVLPTQAELRFALSGTKFDATPDETSVSINGRPVDAAAITIAEHHVAARAVLDEGRNIVRFKSYDEVGRPLYLEKTLWAGSNTLNIRLEDAQGRLLAAPADLTVSMSDAPAVRMSTSTSTGTASFANVPSRTVMVEARSAEGHFGMTGATGEDGGITLRLHGVGSPATVDNNDFSRGIEGWDVGDSPALVVPHVEDVAPGTAPRTSANGMDRERFAASVRAASGTSRESVQSTPVNNDLQITTRGAGPQKVSRTFATTAGTTRVTVRFRFVTSEVPNGFFGSQYNDYFAVSLRSQRGGSIMTESNTMNGLGLQAFDGTGSTAWRTLSLETDPAGDHVRVEATVANTADHLLDSQVLIDFVIEDASPIKPALAWDPAAGGAALTYKVAGGPLASAVDVNVYWANGPSAGDRIGGPILTHTIPAETPEGSGGPIAVSGSLLQNDPQGASHLVAIAGDVEVAALKDVRISYGPHADASTISAELIDVIKDALRASGTDKAVISRTAVQPADQARAMFQNLTRSPGPLSANVAQQLAIYASPGDAVIGVFDNQTRGMTLEQAKLSASAIQAAMTAEVMAQGPERVSKHCADPAKLSVVDMPLSSFTAPAASTFKSSAAARVTKLLNENGVYHLELNK